jgi:hypothetical protein
MPSTVKQDIVHRLLYSHWADKFMIFDGTGKVSSSIKDSNKALEAYKTKGDFEWDELGCSTDFHSMQPLFHGPRYLGGTDDYSTDIFNPWLSKTDTGNVFIKLEDFKFLKEELDCTYLPELFIKRFRNNDHQRIKPVSFSDLILKRQFAYFDKHAFAPPDENHPYREIRLHSDFTFGGGSASTTNVKPPVFSFNTNTPKNHMGLMTLTSEPTPSAGSHWAIIDSGTSMHILMEHHYMSNAKENHTPVAGFSGQTSRATHRGDFSATVRTHQGNLIHLLEKDSALLVPDATRNLYSVRQSLNNGNVINFDTCAGLLPQGKKHLFIPFIRDQSTDLYLLPLMVPPSRHNGVYGIYNADTTTAIDTATTKQAAQGNAQGNTGSATKKINLGKQANNIPPKSDTQND